jgi:hypothetical protein
MAVPCHGKPAVKTHRLISLAGLWMMLEVENFDRFSQGSGVHCGFHATGGQYNEAGTPF